MNTDRDQHALILPILFLCLSFFVIWLPRQIFAQDKAAEKKPFGAEAIWRPTDTIIQGMGKSCENGGNCFISKMIEAGATPAAVEFTKILINNDFPFCFMKSFQEMGHVDQVMVDCPFMANTMGFTILVNGKPLIFLPGDRKYLDKIDMTKDPIYPTIIKKYPNAELWLDGKLDRMITSNDGGQRFIWRHKLLNGCRACEVAGSATVAYDFDGNGNYKDVQLLKLSEEEPCQ